ncbi:MAG: hypothetical protein ABIH69_02060 [bacterium]
MFLRTLLFKNGRWGVINNKLFLYHGNEKMRHCFAINLRFESNRFKADFAGIDSLAALPGSSSDKLWISTLEKDDWVCRPPIYGEFEHKVSDHLIPTTNLGYGVGTMNPSEMEVRPGFMPQFLSLRTIGRIFMPYYTFAKLRREGLADVESGEKFFLTPEGNIPIATYRSDFVDKLCAFDLARLRQQSH